MISNLNMIKEGKGKVEYAENPAVLPAGIIIEGVHYSCAELHTSRMCTFEQVTQVVFFYRSSFWKKTIKSIPLTLNTTCGPFSSSDVSLAF